MNNSNVNNVGNAKAAGNIAVNYNYVQKNSDKASVNSFGNLMQNSLNKMADLSKSNSISEKVSTRRSQVEYIVRGARHTGDGKAVDESVMTGSLKALTDDVKAVVCAVLDMTDEELEKFLAENGMCITDLLVQNNLADFVANAIADGDSLKLLTDSSISEKFSELSDEIKTLVSDTAQEMGISVDELNTMLKSQELLVTDNVTDDKVIEVVENTSDQEKVSNEQQTDNTVNSGIASADTELEDKISITSEESSKSDSEFTGEENENLSGQFLKTLIDNVDNTVNANDFKGNSVSAENIVRQLVDAIKVNVNSSFSEMELQLQPENLGKLNLVISSRDGIITAQLMAENENVKNAIENQLVMLKDNFEQQGLKVDAVEVTVQSHGFETGKNLEGRNEDTQEENRHKSSRSLTLEEINAIIGDEEASDEDVLAAEMLRASGGNVDYMI